MQLVSQGVSGWALTRAAWCWALVLAACPSGAPRRDAGPPVWDAGVVTVDAGDDPDLPRRDAFAGSATCRDCHPSHFDDWKRDWHARALSEPTADTVVGRFNGVHFKGASNEATMTQRAGRFVMRTNDREGLAADYPVGFVIGGKRMQDALTVFPDGRWQVLPIYFHVTGGGSWVDYNEAKQGAVGPNHPFFWTNFRRTANRECIACHATGWRVSYSRADHRWSTDAEPGVGCEACHGPGARHSETKAAADIVAFSKLSPERAMAICASCHGPREPHFPLMDAAHRFTPGQAYDDFFQPAGLVDGTSRSGEYFVDGRPSSSSFEWQALSQSRCWTQGKATCLTCHTGPHGQHASNELPAEGKLADLDGSCVRCHAPEAADRPAHTHHRTVAGQRCTGCHMPPVLSGVLDHFADHALTVPAPEVTASHGVPNACAVCHPKSTTEQLVKQTHDWWGDSTRRQRRVRLADAFDEKTKENSGEALTALVRDETEPALIRGFAAELLGQRFPARAADVLPPLLEAPDAYVRSRVLAGLSSAQVRSARTRVLALTKDDALIVREFAALLLASWGEPGALEALASDPTTRSLARPHLVLAQRAFAEARFATAEHEVQSALQLTPWAGAALVMEADLAVRRRDLQAARAALEEALRFDPANDSARRRLEALQALH